MLHRKPFLHLVPLLICALLLGATSSLAKLKVVTTLPDLAAIASSIGGDDVDVEALLSASQDPHYADPRPSLILSLHRADLLIVNGLELESAWLTPLIPQARNEKIRRGQDGHLDASSFVQKLGVPTAKVSRAQGDIHGGGNPHFTFAPAPALRVAAGIFQRLKALDPEHAAAFEKRFLAFSKEAKALEKKWQQKFSALSLAQKSAVPYHQSLIYFTTWLGITTPIFVEPKPGITPSPGHLAKVLKKMKRENIRVLLQEDYYPARSSQTLAKLGKGKLVLLQGGTRFRADESFLQHLDENARRAYDAMAAFGKGTK